MTDEGLAARSQKAALALLSCALSVSTPSFAQERDASIVVLADGVAVTRSQRANEPLHYLIDARRGQTLLIEVEQRGLDVVVSVESPVGEIRRFNSPLFRDESELVLIDDTYAGRYRDHGGIGRADECGRRARRFIPFVGRGCRCALCDRAAPHERRCACERGIARRRRVASLRKRVAAVGRARRDAAASSSAVQRSHGALLGAVRLERRGQPSEEAAELYEQLDARGLYANAMLTAGYSLMEVAQSSGIEGQRVFEDALAALHESFAVHEALGNDYGLAFVENFTGLAYFNRGHAETQDFREAEKRYRHAAELFAGLGEWREELNARHNLALIGIDEGYAANAARVLSRRSWPIFRPARIRSFAHSVLANLGVAYRDSGDFDAALVALSEAVEIHASLKQLNFEAFALRVLGTTYQALGELERADEYLRQALEKSPEHGRVRSAVMAGLGTVAYQRGEYAAGARLASASPSRARPRRWIGRIGRALSCVISSLCGGSMRRSPPATSCSPVSTHLPLRQPMRLSSLAMRTWVSSKRPMPTRTS